MTRTSDARERLLRTAARLFLTRSYHAVGVDELCAAADVRKGSFYHFFGAKSELAEAVIDRHAEALWAQLDEAGAVTGERPGATRAAPGAAARLHAVADAIGTLQAAFQECFGTLVGCPFGNLAAELATTDDALREHLAAVFAEWEARLSPLCRQAAAEGTLRPGVDPCRFARILVAQCQGMILLGKTRRFPAAEIAAALHQVIDSHLADGAAA